MATVRVRGARQTLGVGIATDQRICMQVWPEAHLCLWRAFDWIGYTQFCLLRHDRALQHLALNLDLTINPYATTCHKQLRIFIQCRLNHPPRRHGQERRSLHPERVHQSIRAQRLSCSAEDYKEKDGLERLKATAIQEEAVKCGVQQPRQVLLLRARVQQRTALAFRVRCSWRFPLVL